MKEVKKMKCAWCGKTFDPSIAGRRKYCSEDCAKEAHLENIKAKYKKVSHVKIGDILKCRSCGKNFVYIGGRRMYCSGECEFVARSTDRKGDTKSKQPCWTCKKACGGCSWSSEFKPVKGWKAKKTKIKCEEGRYSDSYKIIYCPEYIPDDD